MAEMDPYTKYFWKEVERWFDINHVNLNFGTNLLFYNKGSFSLQSNGRKGKMTEKIYKIQH